MLTHLIKSINWIDVGLISFFVWMIFSGVKNGFVSEFFKCIGVVVAVFVSLHYYSFIAAWAAQKTHFSWEYWDLLIFADLWVAVWFFFKFVREGMLVLFKVETNHQGFDKYAAGVLAIGRGILVCSLTIFLILLMHNGLLTRMTARSYSYKIAGRAAVNTYSFLYNNVVSKFAPTEHYNANVIEVLYSGSQKNIK